MSRPWERPLPEPEALEGLQVPPPEAQPARENRALVAFSDEEWEAIEAASDAREGEAPSTTIRVVSVAVADHLLERGVWPKAREGSERPRAPKRDRRALVVFSDAEWALLAEAAMHRLGEPVSATIRALSVAGALFMLQSSRASARKQKRPARR